MFTTQHIKIYSNDKIQNFPTPVKNHPAKVRAFLL